MRSRGIRRALASRLAASIGMELHYPPRPEPDTERAPSNRNDGTPCARQTAPPTTIRRRPLV